MRRGGGASGPRRSPRRDRKTMSDLKAVCMFVERLADVRDPDGLREALADITDRLGFDHFALTHHIDHRAGGADRLTRLHNYPDGWQDWFDEQRLGPSDPVHRASHRTSVGFVWSELDRLIPLSATDHEILSRARRHGIGQGFTVPVHVPGEDHGSCSFATRTGREPRADMLPLAQLAGSYAFDAARRLRPDRGRYARARLTDRQRQCVIWIARGKSDWEISRILGIAVETVTRHLKQARGSLRVDRRTGLAVRALYEQQVSFADVID